MCVLPLGVFFQLDNAASTARPWSVITMREPLRSINPFDDEPRARGGRVAGDFGGAGAGGEAEQEDALRKLLSYWTVGLLSLGYRPVAPLPSRPVKSLAFALFRPLNYRIIEPISYYLLPCCPTDLSPC